MKIVYILLTVLLCGTGPKVIGQIIFEPEGKGDLANGMIYIINGTKQNVHFFLSIDKRKWQDFWLMATQAGNARGEAKPVDFMYIWIYTNSDHVQYKIVPQRRYSIYWNNRWDVREIGSAGGKD
jgi:hypothetical protein